MTAAWGPATRIAFTLAVAALAGALAQAVHAPLPWMIGPLLSTAALSIRGAPVRAWPPLREGGQWAIGTALGLYFTPAVLAAMGRLSWALALGVAWALLGGWLFYRFLRWRHDGEPGMHPGAAYFGGAFGGASEMAALAERHGAPVERVAAAHSLRVMLVVVTIPFAFQLSGLHGLDPAPPAVSGVDPQGLALLVAATVAAGALLRWRRAPSPFVLGPLLVAAGLTAAGLHLSALPKWMTNAGQLFIGVSLGTRFTPDFLRAGPRWLASVAMGSFALMGLSAAFGIGLAALTGLHPATMVLGTSPGGIAEMSITAKVLQLGVPMVTAFHVTRYVAVLLLTGPLWRRLQARGP